MSFDVEVWHDTTMWNEGFEHAREPYALVVVPNAQTAADVAAWVDVTYALSTRAWADSDKAFTARTHPSAPASDGLFKVLPADEAKAYLAERIVEWRGL